MAEKKFYAFAVSDFHGNWYAWQNLRGWVDDLTKGGIKVRVFVLGDTCDRGNQGIEILRQIRADERFFYLIGNHDDFIIRTYRGDLVKGPYTSQMAKEDWLYNTGPSFEDWERLRKNNPEEFVELLEWLANRPVCQKVYCNGKVYNLAHAKYHHNEWFSNMSWREMEETYPDLLFHTLWDRYKKPENGPIESYIEDGATSLIGHTPIPNRNPKLADGLYNLDGGLGYGYNKITLFCLNDGKVYYFADSSIDLKLPEPSEEPAKVFTDLKLDYFENPEYKNLSIDEGKETLSRGERIVAVGTIQSGSDPRKRVRTSLVKEVITTGNGYDMILTKTGSAYYLVT